jgi:ATP-dependent phosphofructokinase / diphosphate-dependent phosphofructokinase
MARTLVIGQSGGPTAVVNASLVGALRAAHEHEEVERVLGARFAVEGMLAADYVDLTDISAEQAEILERTPNAALGSSRRRLTPDDAGLVVDALRAHDVGWLVLIGGNDTADTLHQVHLTSRLGEPIHVVGIPKTIDNDLPLMDHCPGYGSAARYLAIAAREAGLDTSAMRRSDPIKIIEVMGRNAGWLAAATALGRGQVGDAPQVVFLPERPRSLSQMIGEIEAAYREHTWVVAVICENQRDEAGNPLAGGAAVHTDPHGHTYFESPGLHLARSTEAALGVRARYERPGSLQRTAILAMSATDVAEAREAGADAVRRVLRGESDIMVAIRRSDSVAYQVTYDAVPLAGVAHQERRLPDAFIAPSGIDVTDAFMAYARPLIGGPIPRTVSFV